MNLRNQDILKRGLDASSAVILAVLTAPLVAIVGTVVAVKLGRPVFFRQVRPGMNDKPFVMIKFRTMAEPDTARGLLTDADRLTPLGRKLRSTSLDELPALLNVIKGDMSLVGPRPLLVDYLDLYSEEQSRRHHVRPGITGLAQVSGRNAVTWEERLRLDVEYVDRRSLLLDLQILAKTLSTVLRRDGVNQDGHPTMPRFEGTPDASSGTAR